MMQMTLGVLVVLCAFVPVTALGFALPKFVAVSMFALLASIHMLRTNTPVWAYISTRMGKVVTAYIVFLLISPLWSSAPLVSFFGSAPRYQGAVAYILYFVLALYAAKKNNAVEKAIYTSNIIVIAYGVLQMMDMDPLDYYFQSEVLLGRTFSFLGNPNMLGQYIVMTLPFVWKKSRYLLLFNLVVLLGTVSRSAILALFVMSILAAPQIKQSLKNYVEKLSVMQAVGIALMVILTVSVGATFFVQRFSGTFATGRSSSARVVLWESLTTMVAERPTGYGLETLAFTTPKFIPKDIYQFEPLTVITDRAHNIILHHAVTVGIAGAVLFLFMIGVLLLNTKKTAYQRAASLSIVGYLVCMLFGFSSHATAMLFFLMVGILLGETKQKPNHLMLSRVVQIACITVSLFATVLSVQWSVARATNDPSRFSYDREVLLSSAERALQQGDTHTADVLTEQLYILTNGYDGMVPVLSAWSNALENERLKARANLRRAEEFYPQTIAFYRVATHIAGLMNDDDQVEEYRDKLRNLLPEAFFDEESELRRILIKQHPWVVEFE